MKKIGWIGYIRMLLKGRAAVQEAVHQAALVKNVHAKASWKSTEFIVAVLTALGAIAAQVQGVVPEPIGAIVASASAAFYAISRGLAKNGDPIGGIKPGLATTELVVTVLAQAGAILSSVAGAVKPETAAILVMISNGAYGLSRGLAKGGAQLQE